MKKRDKILACVLLVIAVVSFIHFRDPARELRASVKETKERLRQEGFRTEVPNFNLALPTETDSLARLIKSAGGAAHLYIFRELELRRVIGTNAALAISPIAVVPTSLHSNIWPALKVELAPIARQLDEVCAALRTGTIRHQPNIRPDGDVLQPYLSQHKDLATALAARAALALHELDNNAFFTNVFALSRLATAWNPEPTEPSHLVRFACQSIAEKVIWESMQTDCWNETELARFQKEWESVRFFDGLAETAEFSCASMILKCESIRNRSFIGDNGGIAAIVRTIFNAPGSAIQYSRSILQDYSKSTSYKVQGSFEDEKALLCYYRDKAEELKRASRAATWLELRLLLETTNAAFPVFKHSEIDYEVNKTKHIFGKQSLVATLAGRAAESEAKRRLIVTAIALERFAIQHKIYPKALIELVPAFLSSTPVDFMDGKELRYRLREDGRYLLYSVGLDCVDNGGVYARRGNNEAEGTDLVWLFPARQKEIDAVERTRAEEAATRLAKRLEWLKTITPKELETLLFYRSLTPEEIKVLPPEILKLLPEGMLQPPVQPREQKKESGGKP